MGQGLACYECLWHNQCYSNVGFSVGLGFCSAWLCIPVEMQQLRGNGVVQMGPCNQGWGSSFFCEGGYCLIPDWLRDYSKWQSIGERRGQLYNLNITEVGVPVAGYGGQQQFQPAPAPQPYQPGGYAQPGGYPQQQPRYNQPGYWYAKKRLSSFKIIHLLKFITFLLYYLIIILICAKGCFAKNASSSIAATAVSDALSTSSAAVAGSVPIPPLHSCETQNVSAVANQA